MAHHDVRATRWIWPTFVVASAASVFSLTLAPTVTAEDSGELIAAAWHFGVPHPPGYPLWTVLCGAFCHAVPLGSIAFRANLFSALCSSAAAGVTFGALRAGGFSRPAAAGAALVWIWSRWSWSQSVLTEVYALNSLLTVSLLWCALHWYRTRKPKVLLIASLLFGLGMANHHTIALVAMALVAWILIQSPSLLRRGRLIVCSIGLFIIGLLPYLYLPIRASADPVVNWGDPSTADRFWTHVTRGQYGAIGPMAVEEPRSLYRLVNQVAYACQAIADDLTPWLLGVAMAGMILLLRRQRQLALLVVLWLLCTGGIFVALANYDLDRTSRWAMRVFFIIVSLGLMIPFACVIDALSAAVHRGLAGRARVAAGACVVLAMAAPASQLLAHWRQCDYSNYWYARDHARNMLHCMLPNAMIFPSGDHNTFPLVYLTAVEGQRQDVVIADIYGYIGPNLVADRPPDSKDAPETWLVKKARRPAYYTTKKRSPVEGASYVQAGLLYHLLPDGKSFNDSGLLDTCGYHNLERRTVLDFGASHILVDFEFSSGLAALRAQDRPGALDHFRTAAEYGEGVKEVFNNIGSALGEHGVEAEAIGYFKQAARLDWRYALPRWNLFRLYRSQQRWIDARRQLAEIIEADPSDPRAYGELGFLLESQFDDFDGAVRAWRTSLQLFPNQPQVADALKRNVGG